MSDALEPPASLPVRGPRSNPDPVHRWRFAGHTGWTPPPRTGERARIEPLAESQAAIPAQPRWTLHPPLEPDDAAPVLPVPVDDAGVRSVARARTSIGVRVAPWVLLAALVAGGALVRVWQIGAVGFNTDEAVYVGQAAAIANDPDLKPYFPLFRAHPLLFQFVLAVVFGVTGIDDVVGRLVSVGVGMLTVVVAFLLGRLLYGTRAGLIAAALLAFMPYHVVVTRQVLLDGPMTLCATLALYAIARYAMSREPTWLYAAGAAMGLTFLAKETGIILFGAIYALFALAPEIPVRLRDLALSVAAFVAVVAAFPLAIAFAGGGGHTSAQQYLVWQLFRRPNHEADFYLVTVPPAVGVLVIAAAAIGLLLARRSLDWRDRLLVAWIAVVVVFFQLWPVKGFQYLLPAAPPLVILAARGILGLGSLGRLGSRLDDGLRTRVGSLGGLVGATARSSALAAVVIASLVATSWPLVQPSESPRLLAGAGGVPGGRETGSWIRAHTPTGAQFMTIGPSMANILAFYGHRRAYGLSVSPNPLRRNPSYTPIENPDLQIRANELQYAVWDSYSAARSPFFAAKLQRYVERYQGRVVYTETVAAPAGGEVPVIVVYEVRP